MTTMPPSHLRLTAVDSETTVRIELHGDLDFDNADQLLTAVTGKLTDNPHLRDLHLHCAGLGITDSMGLAILLMIRRRADEANVRLHLDDRAPALNRMLSITGTLDHLTAPPADAGDDFAEAEESPAGQDQALSARLPSPDHGA